MREENLVRNIAGLFWELNYSGYSDSTSYKVVLYDIVNNKGEIASIRAKIQSFTSKYKLVVLSPNDELTNINILDIGL